MFFCLVKAHRTMCYDLDMATKKKKAESLGFEYTCQKCRKRVRSTHQRTLYTKDYMGPCGDSFCYHSCTMSTCHPITVTVCDVCANELSR